MRLAVALAAALLLTGCSGGDDGADAKPEVVRTTPSAVYTDATIGLRDLFRRASPESTVDEADCVGYALVEGRGLERLTEDGLLDEDGQAVDALPPLDRDAAAAWVDAWFGCVDFTTVAGRAQKKVTKTLDVKGFERCFTGRLSGAQIREAATDGLSGDTSSAAVRRLSRAQRACAELND